MKKLLAILLSVMMAASLAVPAFADGPDGPAPVDGGAGCFVNGEAAPVYTPGEAIPISAFLPEATNDAVLDIIGGADGPTSIITSGPIDFSGLDIPSLDDIDWDNYFDEVLEQNLKERRDEMKKALGGVPGQVGVMVNGEYIKFPDAAPEVTNEGSVMAPVRALVEAMGGEVKVDGDKVACTVGDDTMTFEMHDANVDVERQNPGDGKFKTEWVTMPIAAYVKNGRTYVPVRFTAQTLGYDVGWDNAYQTAILLDRDALAAEIDKSFTILNKVQANKSVGMEEGKNYLADVKENLTLNLFDTLNGSKTYKADLTGKQIFNTDAASASLSLKLSDNALSDLEKVFTDLYGADFEEYAGLFHTVMDGLEDMEVILTRDGSVWFRAAALDELAGEDNVWLAADLGADWGQLAFAQAGDTTIGKVLTQSMPCVSVTEWSSAMEMVEALNTLYGDDKFTTSGGASTLTIDLDSLMGLYEGMGLDADDIETVKSAFKEYKITMKVDSKGATVMTCVMETAAQTGVPGMKITMDVKQSAGNVAMNMNCHIANLGEMKLEAAQTQKATADKPLSEPPEGSTIVDVDNGAELLNP